ncbi:MAG TPA: sulfurtransferase [Candidatus Limnocylindrales bacterium]|nr:sulfurtransferase [Candidatus Limnocylindrales bacterium]
MKRSSPLIPAADLLELVGSGDPDLRIVDCRWVLGVFGAGAAAYASGHLPGAVHLDLDTDLSDPRGYGAPGRHPLPTPAAFVARVARVGIADTSFVVAYDDVGGWVAARLWWMLDVLGHPAVAVLDGGMAAWTASGGELTTDMPDPAPAELHLGTEWSRVIDRAELKERLGSVVLLDARGAPRYRGETEPIDPVAGHIPTARNATVDDNLVEPGGPFRPPAQLASHFHDLGADGTAGPVVTSCGSGVSALHHAIALRAAGLPDPILYVGSYSDWSRSGEPVVTGPEPGDPPQG